MADNKEYSNYVRYDVLNNFHSHFHACFVYSYELIYMYDFGGKFLEFFSTLPVKAKILEYCNTPLLLNIIDKF